MRVYIINGRKWLKYSKICVIAFLIIIVGAAIYRRESTLYAISSNVKPVIIIDAGHGGEDPGAIGNDGTYEKDINLAIALTIGEELKNRGYSVIYTRTDDRMLYLPEENIKGMRKISDLKNRCKFTAEYDNCIFVSIHMNSYGASKYSGLQVYYKDGSEDSQTLAAKIQSAVKKELQPTNNRQTKNGKSLYLLENSMGTPVLIECGFLSNEDECKKLSQKEYQKELSFSIICGIIEYINQKNDVV